MLTVEECVCCKDIAKIRTAKLCITLEADFEALCLNTAVLRAAQIDVPVSREHAEIVDDHMQVQSTEIVQSPQVSLCCRRYKYTAYRQVDLELPRTMQQCPAVLRSAVYTGTIPAGNVQRVPPCTSAVSSAKRKKKRFVLKQTF